MQKHLFLATVLVGLMFAGVASAQTNTDPAQEEGVAAAQALAKITFPIAELGNCSSREACKAYCDDSAHSEACFSFAQKNGLMSKEKVVQAKKFKGLVGPGGCTGEVCKIYCRDESHKEECTSFAQKNGIQVKMRIAALRENASTTALFKDGMTGPGGCTTREACKAYCDESSHADECLQFAQKHKLMSSDAITAAKKLTNAQGPGGCHGIECKAYCSDESHKEECMAFAKEHGLLREAAVGKGLIQRAKMGSTTEERPGMMRKGTGSSTMPFKKDMPRPGTRVGSTTPAMQEQMKSGMMRPGAQGAPGMQRPIQPPPMMKQELPEGEGNAVEGGQSSLHWTAYPAAVIDAIGGLLR